MSENEYHILDKDKKIEILNGQLTELEIQHFSYAMSEPNRFKAQTEQYVQWQQGMSQFEDAIEKLRREKSKLENG
jgi:hypothetical protein